MEIDDSRAQINKIDFTLLNLLEKRFEICKQLGQYKRKNNLPIENLDREKEIIENAVKNSNLSREFIEDLFKLICQKPWIKDPGHVNSVMVFDHYQNSTSGSNHLSQTSGILKFKESKRIQKR